MNDLSDAYNAMVEDVLPSEVSAVDAPSTSPGAWCGGHDTCRARVADALPKAHKEWVEALREWSKTHEMPDYTEDDDKLEGYNEAMIRLNNLLREHLRDLADIDL